MADEASSSNVPRQVSPSLMQMGEEAGVDQPAAAGQQERSSSDSIGVGPLAAPHDNDAASIATGGQEGEPANVVEAAEEGDDAQIDITGEAGATVDDVVDGAAGAALGDAGDNSTPRPVEVMHEEAPIEEGVSEEVRQDGVKPDAASGGQGEEVGEAEIMEADATLKEGIATTGETIEPDTLAQATPTEVAADLPAVLPEQQGQESQERQEQVDAVDAEETADQGGPTQTEVAQAAEAEQSQGEVQVIDFAVESQAEEKDATAAAPISEVPPEEVTADPPTDAGAAAADVQEQTSQVLDLPGAVGAVSADDAALALQEGLAEGTTDMALQETADAMTLPSQEPGSEMASLFGEDANEMDFMMGGVDDAGGPEPEIPQIIEAADTHETPDEAATAAAIKVMTEGQGAEGSEALQVAADFPVTTEKSDAAVESEKTGTEVATTSAEQAQTVEEPSASATARGAEATESAAAIPAATTAETTVEKSEEAKEAVKEADTVSEAAKVPAPQDNEATQDKAATLPSSSAEPAADKAVAPVASAEGPAAAAIPTDTAQETKPAEAATAATDTTKPPPVVPAPSSDPVLSVTATPLSPAKSAVDEHVLKQIALVLKINKELIRLCVDLQAKELASDVLFKDAALRLQSNLAFLASIADRSTKGMTPLKEAPVTALHDEPFPPTLHAPDSQLPKLYHLLRSLGMSGKQGGAAESQGQKRDRRQSHDGKRKRTKEQSANDDASHYSPNNLSMLPPQNNLLPQQQQQQHVQQQRVPSPLSMQNQRPGVPSTSSPAQLTPPRASFDSGVALQNAPQVMPSPNGMPTNPQQMQSLTQAFGPNAVNNLQALQAHYRGQQQAVVAYMEANVPNFRTLPIQVQLQHMTSVQNAAMQRQRQQTQGTPQQQQQQSPIQLQQQAHLRRTSAAQSPGADSASGFMAARRTQSPMPMAAPSPSQQQGGGRPGTPASSQQIPPFGQMASPGSAQGMNQSFPSPQQAAASPYGMSGIPPSMAPMMANMPPHLQQQLLQQLQQQQQHQQQQQNNQQHAFPPGGGFAPTQMQANGTLWPHQQQQPPTN